MRWRIREVYKITYVANVGDENRVTEVAEAAMAAGFKVYHYGMGRASFGGLHVPRGSFLVQDCTEEDLERIKAIPGVVSVEPDVSRFGTPLPTEWLLSFPKHYSVEEVRAQVEQAGGAILEVHGWGEYNNYFLLAGSVEVADDISLIDDAYELGPHSKNGGGAFAC